MPSRYLVLGAGAIGGSVGAYMADAGLAVEFADVDEAHVAAMREGGLTIDAPDGHFTVPVEAHLPHELTAGIDVVLLAVKAHSTANALEPILDVIGPDSVVVSLQNGLTEIDIRDVVGPERTIGGFINISADYLEPGLVQFGGWGAFYVGELDGAITDRVSAIAVDIGVAGKVQVTDNIWGYNWGKLGYASMIYATALADEAQYDVMDRYRELMVELAAEVFEVAEREGVGLMSFDGIEPGVLRRNGERDWDAVGKSYETLLEFVRDHQKPRSGVWRDLAVRKRRTEVDQHLGVPVDIGRTHGLDMVLNEALVDLIHELENGDRSMSWDNVEELDRLRHRAMGRS